MPTRLKKYLHSQFQMKSHQLFINKNGVLQVKQIKINL